MKFTKMHGIGNDYIYVDCLDGTFGGDDKSILSDDARLGKLARFYSDRHKGIGADGMILIMRSDIADVRMRMFNADGSEGKMCGNGSRCVGKYVYDHNYITSDNLTLETASGVKCLKLHIGADGKVDQVTVDMGAPIIDPTLIPVVPTAETIFDMPVECQDKKFKVTAVSMGNPHGVIFTDAITDELVHDYGRMLEVDEIWPDRANIEFARIIDDSNIEMRVWERGSGETLACGTGACATAVAAMLGGKVVGESITIHLLGGDLKISIDKETNHVMMTGPATEVYTGNASIDI